MISIFEYIRHTWSLLTYSLANLPDAVIDAKLKPLPNGKWPLYIASTEEIGRIRNTLVELLPAKQLQTVELRQLGPDTTAVTEHGLLYLPHPYVVPGGRFREMYGWDSYFIVRGLLLDNLPELAQSMADNHLYQVRHYGTVLNANRTYYLSRSQPPFLTRMLLAIFDKTQNKEWLGASLPTILKYYSYWKAGLCMTKTGLSRFIDSEKTPAAEVTSERVSGKEHYAHAAQYYAQHMDAITEYDASEYFNKETGKLTAQFYWGDRSMRASGFDPSWRFGPFNIDIIHYNPVCLNALLYQMESDIACIYGLLGDANAVAAWTNTAKKRSALINSLLWNEEEGLYYDYNFLSQKQRRYPFLTTFYPLWTGLASPTQAEKVRNNLELFETRGGLVTSIHESGAQWDAPYGWAPLILIAVEGLRRYGYTDDADRISIKFLSLTQQEYAHHGMLYEKYDVAQCSSQTKVEYGYSENVTGFGWTNATFLALYHELPVEKQRALNFAQREQVL